MGPMEDRLLVLRCKRGCGKSLTRIYEKYRRDMLFLAMALLNDSGMAEDVVHDVFVGFVEGISGFRLTGHLKGYLLTCVANRARNINKAKHSQALEAGHSESIEHRGPDALDRLVCNEQLKRLATAMEQLPSGQRETIMLHLYGGMTLRALAKMQGQSSNTVKSRYRYGLDKLRHLLNGEIEP
jgi:RNA polymerase sigma factor (sigma-70 family)